MERDASLLHLCIDSFKIPFFSNYIALWFCLLVALSCQHGRGVCGVLCSHSRVVVVMCIPSVAIDH